MKTTSDSINCKFNQLQSFKTGFTHIKLQNRSICITMEFHFNFNKPTISKNGGEFLNSNLKYEKEKDLLNRILSGRKLQYGDANMWTDIH